jgi:hypothetical protein
MMIKAEWSGERGKLFCPNGWKTSPTLLWQWFIFHLTAHISHPFPKAPFLFAIVLLCKLQNSNHYLTRERERATSSSNDSAQFEIILGIETTMSMVERS